MNTITLNNSEQFDGYFKVDASDNDTEVAYFKANMNEAREAFKKDIEGTEEAEIEANFMIYCQNNIEEYFICEHDFVPINNDGKHSCRFCGEIEE